MNAIVISIGGLNTGALGCYGCDWVATPNIDRLAVDGFVFDNCFVDSIVPAAVRRAWWTGRHPWQAHTQRARESADIDLIASLRVPRVATILIRDTSELCGDSTKAESTFGKTVDFNHAPQNSVERLFQAARKWLDRSSADKPILMFIDCHGAHRPWPLVIEGDDTGMDVAGDASDNEVSIHDSSAACDELEMGDACEDPLSELARAAYSTVVSELDAQLGIFLDYLRRRDDWDDTMIVCTSDLGISVSEHATAFSLTESHIHIPLVIRMPGCEPARRSLSLAQAVDLLPSVFDAMAIPVPAGLHGRSLMPVVRGELNGVRETVAMAGPTHDRSIRTTDWYLMRSASPDTTGSEVITRLFEKPQDRWERNDVSNQYAETRDALERRLLDIES